MFMYCPKCMSNIDDGCRVCPECAHILRQDINSAREDFDDIEKTMAIPVIRDTEAVVNVNPSKSVRVPKSAKRPAPNTKPAEQMPGKSRVLSGGAIFAITFVISAVVILTVMLIFVLCRDVTPRRIQDISGMTDLSQSPSDEGTKEQKPVEGEQAPEGESVGIEEEIRAILIDTDFDFAFGMTLDLPERGYRTLKSSDPEYRCDIPDDFKFVSDSMGEIRYRAQDNTAYIDIGAISNKASLAPEDIKSKVKSDLGGSVLYEKDGDGWFSMNIQKDGISYYQKCYVDDSYIRYAEFVYPSEYSSVYGECVKNTEETFIIG